MPSDRPPGDLGDDSITAGDAGLLSPVRAGLPIEAATSDAAYLRALLDAEAALARAQARAGTMPAAAAVLIARVAGATGAGLPDDRLRDLAARARGSGNPVVPLVADLRSAVAEADPDAARYVHHGATSQDIMDTAAMLVAARATGLIVADLDRALAALAALARRYRDTPMAARTLGGHAVPTTFGLKVAGWLLGCLDARDELARRRAALPVQLGGAAGTLAAFGADPALIGGFAGETGLADPVLPWHTRRTPVLRLGAALTEVAAALGKLATDVVLLAQTEVGEVAEPAGAGRGGSSAMPHKRNPALSVMIRSAALQVPALVQVLGTAAGSAEHERPAGAWHAEWQPLRECLRLTGGAAATAAELAGGLRVFPERMRAGLDLTGGGIMSERLAARLGRERVDDLVRRAGEAGVTLRELLTREDAAAAELLDPAGHLGAAPVLADRAVAEYERRRSSGEEGRRDG